jgi:hypothetical protein
MPDPIEGATPEEEVVIEQPATMEDTLRDTLREIQSRGEPPAVPEDVIPVEAKPEGKPRDEAGKFKAGDVIAPPAGEPPAETAAAPNTWKKEAAAHFAALPPEVRAEVARREADFHKGIEQYRQAATFAQTMEKAITPYAATLQSLGITPDKAVAELMASDHRLRYGQPAEKLATIRGLAQHYGVDLGQLTQHQEQQYVDPNVSALQQQVQQLTQHLQQQQLTGQQQVQESLNSEIQAFAADPSHSHFESVKGHMAALLQAGQARDLPDAYEQAVYANPTTRAAMLQQQAVAQREEAAKAAKAAKTAASVNVRSRAAMPVSQPIGSMEDTMRAILAKHAGAA